MTKEKTFEELIEDIMRGNKKEIKSFLTLALLGVQKPIQFIRKVGLLHEFLDDFLDIPFLQNFYFKFSNIKDVEKYFKNMSKEERELDVEKHVKRVTGKDVKATEVRQLNEYESEKIRDLLRSLDKDKEEIEKLDYEEEPITETLRVIGEIGIWIKKQCDSETYDSFISFLKDLLFPT